MSYRCIIYSSKIPTMKTPPICLFQLASPVSLLCCQMYTFGRTLIKKTGVLVCHYFIIPK